MRRLFGVMYTFFFLSWTIDLVDTIIILNKALMEHGVDFIGRVIVCYLGAIPLALMIKLFYYDAFDYFFGGEINA